VIEDPALKDRGTVSGRRSLFAKLLQARRAYYATQRKAALTRKEIVEVDKVVFKEVPVEVVKKEFVHVPFYTNDKRLLNMDLNARDNVGPLDEADMSDSSTSAHSGAKNS